MENKNDLSKIKDHLIVCGHGNIASEIAIDLARRYSNLASHTNKDSVLISRKTCIFLSTSESFIEEHQQKFPEFIYKLGSPEDDEKLKECSINTAFGMFAVMDDYKSNLFITFSARQLNPRIRIVASTTDIASATPKFRRAGANSIISKSFIGGMRIVSDLGRPNTSDFTDEILHNKNSNFAIAEGKIDEDSKYRNMYLRDCDFHQSRIQALALLRHEDGVTEYNPGPDTFLEVGDKIILLGRAQDIALADGITFCSYNS